MAEGRLLLRLSEKDAEFLREALRWGRHVYSEAANKYLGQPGYKETVVTPQLAQYDAMLLRLRATKGGTEG